MSDLALSSSSTSVVPKPAIVTILPIKLSYRSSEREFGWEIISLNVSTSTKQQPNIWWRLLLTLFMSSFPHSLNPFARISRCDTAISMWLKMFAIYSNPLWASGLETSFENTHSPFLMSQTMAGRAAAHKSLCWLPPTTLSVRYRAWSWCLHTRWERAQLSSLWLAEDQRSDQPRNRFRSLCCARRVLHAR